MSCSHKFVDTDYCVKCGDTLESIKAAGYDEAMLFLEELTDEVMTLEARVAELEAAFKLSIRDVLERESRMARAEAELEYDPMKCHQTALAILRGEST